MIIKQTRDIPEEFITDPSVKGITRRILLSPLDGTPLFTMRQFTVEKEGFTFHHSHDYEHEIYVLEGSGEILEESGAHPLERGSAVLVEPNEMHQIRNTGQAPLVFLCLIPNQD
ncbi:MAG: cupin domain-containing protein [Candidatus Aminicenantes bacterium]|nr:cupin domain-containing protein [Candidatus Aminicenantes bacterium]